MEYQAFIEAQLDEHSLSSDDTEFMDLPLPPIPLAIARAPVAVVDEMSPAPQPSTQITKMPCINELTDDYDHCLSNYSSISSSCSDDDNVTPHIDSKWCTSDEDSSFYREQSSLFRSTSLNSNLCINNNHNCLHHFSTNNLRKNLI